ncbi:hypothetical protein BC938DRAFT_482963, partial [Jimgerdemannia flammicorona]
TRAAHTRRPHAPPTRAGPLHASRTATVVGTSHPLARLGGPLAFGFGSGPHAQGLKGCDAEELNAWYPPAPRTSQAPRTSKALRPVVMMMVDLVAISRRKKTDISQATTIHLLQSVIYPSILLFYLIIL